MATHLPGFWQAIEHVAWRRYFREPRTMSYGIEAFDFYPKGTTALIAPTALLIEAFDAFDPTVGDWHKVNDDTAVLRWVAERTPINISPHYASTYNARTSLSAFLRHAEHRGTVLIDGYLRPGARFAGPIVGVLAATPLPALVPLSSSVPRRRFGCRRVGRGRARVDWLRCQTHRCQSSRVVRRPVRVRLSDWHVARLGAAIQMVEATTCGMSDEDPDLQLEGPHSSGGWWRGGVHRGLRTRVGVEGARSHVVRQRSGRPSGIRGRARRPDHPARWSSDRLSSGPQVLEERRRGRVRRRHRRGRTLAPF